MMAQSTIPNLAPDHDLLWGTKLADTVAWCVTDAIRLNTAGGWRRCANQLQGIDCRLLAVYGGTKAGTHNLLALNNELRRAELLTESDDARAVLAAVLAGCAPQEV